ncbi:MAG: DUF2442 domain-containing protein [Planctomycetota bacterium JB042]
MPTVLRIGSTRFFFYSNERDEPPHVHVERAGGVAKFWLHPVSLPSRGESRRTRCVESRGRSKSTDGSSSEPGMSTSGAEIDPRATTVTVTEEELTVSLRDGRRVSVPLTWFPRLLRAAETEREAWRLVGGGAGIQWPALDEDLSVAGLLRGTAAPGASTRAV